MKKRILMATVPALLAVACGSSGPKTTNHPQSSGSSITKPTVIVKTATIRPYGTVLVNYAGHALYVFSRDKAKNVTCVGACAKIWPRLALPSDAKTKVSGSVKAPLLDVEPYPGGGRVVTYNHWPLYAHVTDTTPGVAHGQGLKLNGGSWYLISPSGTVIKTKKASSSSSGYKY